MCRPMRKLSPSTYTVTTPRARVRQAPPRAVDPRRVSAPPSAAHPRRLRRRGRGDVFWFRVQGLVFRVQGLVFSV
jgi:hypothetical protein